MDTYIAMSRVSDEKVDLICKAGNAARESIAKDTTDLISLIPDGYIRVFVAVFGIIPFILVLSPIATKVLLYMSILFFSISVVYPSVSRRWMCVSTWFMFYINPFVTKMVARSLRGKNIPATRKTREVESMAASLMRTKYLTEAEEIIRKWGYESDIEKLKELERKIDAETAILTKNDEHDNFVQEPVKTV